MRKRSPTHPLTSCSSSSSLQGSSAPYCNDTEDDSPEKPAPDKRAGTGRWNRLNTTVKTWTSFSAASSLSFLSTAVPMLYASRPMLRKLKPRDRTMTQIH